MHFNIQGPNTWSLETKTKKRGRIHCSAPCNHFRQYCQSFPFKTHPQLHPWPQYTIPFLVDPWLSNIPNLFHFLETICLMWSGERIVQKQQIAPILALFNIFTYYSIELVWRWFVFFKFPPWVEPFGTDQSSSLFFCAIRKILCPFLLNLFMEYQYQGTSWFGVSELYFGRSGVVNELLRGISVPSHFLNDTNILLRHFSLQTETEMNDSLSKLKLFVAMACKQVLTVSLRVTMQSSTGVKWRPTTSSGCAVDLYNRFACLHMKLLGT